MIELIDVPTCNPFGAADFCGSSSRSEPSLTHSINEDTNCVRLRDTAVRSKRETVEISPAVHAAILRRIARLLRNGGGRIAARFPSWLSRFLSDVDVHHWPAPFH
jgi:serine O-acetyltransferase